MTGGKSTHLCQGDGALSGCQPNNYRNAAERPMRNEGGETSIPLGRQRRLAVVDLSWLHLRQQIRQRSDKHTFWRREESSSVIPRKPSHRIKCTQRYE